MSELKPDEDIGVELVSIAHPKPKGWRRLVPGWFFGAKAVLSDSCLESIMIEIDGDAPLSRAGGINGGSSMIEQEWI